MEDKKPKGEKGITQPKPKSTSVFIAIGTIVCLSFVVFLIVTIAVVVIILIFIFAKSNIILIVNTIVLSQHEQKQVYTGNEFVESFCYNNNIIVAVGDETAVLNECSNPERIVIDEGNIVVPGFIDSHLHIFSGGSGIEDCNLGDARSVDDMVSVVTRWIEDHPEDLWIVCSNWIDAGWVEKPDIHTLSDISTTVPIVVGKFDGHSMLINSKSVEICNITNTTYVPGGEIGVKDGKLDGYLYEKAMELVINQLPQIDYVDALKKGMEYLVSYGITQVSNMGNSMRHERNEMEVKTLHQFNEENSLLLRVYQAVNLQQVDWIVDWISQHGAGDDMFKVGLLKEFMDGSKTALQFVPYLNDTDNYGIQVWSDSDLYDLVKKGEEANLQVAIHAIGEKAIYKVLETYGNISRNYPYRDRRFRIEHSQQIRDEDLHLYTEYNVTTVMNPAHIHLDLVIGEKVLDEISYQHLHRTKEMIGVTHTAFGSDWDVMIADPFLGIYNAVKYRDLTVGEVLNGFNYEAAYVHFAEDKTGSIKKDFLADFVVLDQDIFTVETEKILETKVLKTYCNGEKVYQNTN